MSRPDDNNTSNTEPVSVVEDLDPEPAGSADTGRTREMAMGLIVVLAVLAWVFATWWHDDSNRTHYDQAQRAVTNHRWDDALANYSSAKGYKDADARATYAAKQIEERDGQYEVAKAHEQSGPAALVLQAARAVLTIEPGYKDMDRVAKQAENQVYTDALSGTVVMRTAAQPPGLYYRGSSGWQYLQKSDRWSSVLCLPLGNSSVTYIVYDVPGPGWISPTATSTPTPGTPSPPNYEITEGSPSKAGRRLVRATLPNGAGEPGLESLQFNPVDYNYYICGDAGVWGLRYNPAASEPIILAKGTNWGFTMAYEKVGQRAPGQAGSGTVSPITTAVAQAVPVVMPGTDSAVADFGHSGDRLLLAAYGPKVDSKTSTQLLVAKADGSDARVVFSTTDALVSALLSPDEQHVLVVAGQPLQAPAGKTLVSAILLTVDGSVEPILLQEITVDDSTYLSPLVGQLSISGVFLEQGAFKNKLLLGWTESTPAASVRIWLLDVADPGKVLVETSIPYEHMGNTPVIQQPDGHTLLLYNFGVGAATQTSGLLTVELQGLHIETGTDSVTTGSYNVPIPQPDASTGSLPYFLFPMLRGAYLVYMIETFSTASMQAIFNIYTVPLAGVDGGRDTQAKPPALVYSTTWSVGQSSGNYGPATGVAGPNAYAYTDTSGTLHARLYDSDVDVPLEKGVGAIIALNAPYYSQVLR